MSPRKPPEKVRGVYEYPAGSNIWWIQYFWNGRHRERAGRRSDAISLYQKRQTEKLQGQKLPELQRKRITVGDLIDDVLASVADHKSYKDYEQKGKLVRKAFGDKAAESLSAGEIKRWIEKREVAPATFNRYRAFFSLMYKEAMLAKKVRENPARLLRLKREPKGRQRFLDRDKEFPKLHADLEAIDQDRADAFLFSVFVGPRLSEQFRLDWPRVHFDRRVVEFVDTKNGSSRDVEMNSLVLEMMKRRRAQHPKSRGRVFGSLRQFCCVDPKKSQKKSEAFTGESPKWFAEFAIEHGIEDYTWHNNRHTFCSWLAIAAVPIKTIQELAGHRSIQTTLRYAHLSPDHRQSEVEKLVGMKPKVVQFPDRAAAG